MDIELEQATQLVTKIQIAHRLSVGFYQRILPLFDIIASKSGDFVFWCWEPNQTARPCRSASQPSNSWAWDFLPLFASSYTYWNSDNEAAKRGDTALTFHLYIDDMFKSQNRERLGISGQPDPMVLPNGNSVVEVMLYQMMKADTQTFGQHWEELGWLEQDSDWQQQNNTMQACAKKFPLDLFISSPSEITEWIKIQLENSTVVKL